MSDKQPGHKTIDILYALNEEKLKEILRTEMQSDEIDIKLIKRVNSVLRAKSIQQTNCDVNASWRDFVNEHSVSEPLYTYDASCGCNRIHNLDKPRKRSFRPRIAIAAAIIIVFVLGSTITAYAFKYNLWEAIAGWTSETFRFTYSADSKEENISPSHTANNAGANTDLQAVLDEYKITNKLVPKYLPEGFELTELKAIDMGMGGIINFSAAYVKDERTIVIHITKNMTQSGAYHEKDEGDPEIYNAGGIKHYIMTNMGNYKAVWVNGHFECGICGLESKEELIKMIDSIYN